MSGARHAWSRRTDELDSLELVARTICAEVRASVVPHLGAARARDAVGTAPGGDTTLRVDEIAEVAVERVMQAAGDLAYYSEDRGLVRVGRPRATFVIDPIDGTRPAAAGFEAACVSVAVVPPDDDATLGDVAFGVVQELRAGRTFSARRGEGARVESAAGRPLAITRSTNGDLDNAFLGGSNRARPLIPLGFVLGELVDRGAMRGAWFELGSATFAMACVVTGQLDGYVDPGQRMLDACPEVEVDFRTVGSGSIATNFPYDVAAATLVVAESGGVVSDAAGRPIDGCRAVGSGPGFGLSVVAAANRVMHEAIIGSIDRGIDRLADWLRARDHGSSA